MRHNRRALPGERRKTVPRPGQTEPSLVLKREDGIAMLTVLMLTLILTVIGLAAITSTSLDIKMAGGERVRESSVNAAEDWMSRGVKFSHMTMAYAAICATLTGAGANPSITLPLGTAPGQNPLQAEIMGQSDGNPDSADPTVGSTRNAVLDRKNTPLNSSHITISYAVKCGNKLQFAAGYQG